MADMEKVIKALEVCVNRVPGKYSCYECTYENDGNSCEINLTKDAIALLKEQEKLVDVDALREKLGLAKDCAKCKQNTRMCQYDSHFSLMDFCERLDIAIEDLLQEGR